MFVEPSNRPLFTRLTKLPLNQSNHSEVQTMPRGGARTGAGRPKGGVSRMRMMLEEAARKGMAEAYYRANPKQRNKLDEEEAAIQAAAQVVTEMMENGRGDDVLKFAAYVGTPDSERSKTSTLAEALAKLPGSNQADSEPLFLTTDKIDKDTPPPPTPAGSVVSIGKQRKS